MDITVVGACIVNWGGLPTPCNAQDMCLFPFAVAAAAAAVVDVAPLLLISCLFLVTVFPSTAVSVQSFL